MCQNYYSISNTISIMFLFQCETLGFEGWGFRRGGYQCACQPGYYYPWWHDGPFLGEEIEQATKEEYENGFDCLPIYGSYKFMKINYQQLVFNYVDLEHLPALVFFNEKSVQQRKGILKLKLMS